MPKPTDAIKELFRGMLPPGDRVIVKPMFGQLAGFINGNMFGGTFGDTLFVRVLGPDRATLLSETGTSLLEPMAGRPMKEYVVLPAAWYGDRERVESWMTRAIEATAALPPKAPTKKRGASAPKPARRRV